MQLIVIAVLSLVLALHGPLYRLVPGPGATLCAVALVTILPLATAAALSRRVLRRLEASPQDPGPGQELLGAGTLGLQVLVGVSQAALITLTDWLTLCEKLAVVGEWPVVPGLIASVPLLAAVTLVWTALYPAERAVRQIALEVYLLRGKPAHPVWTLGQYVWFNLRHQVLFLLIPTGLILLARDLVVAHEPALRGRFPFLPDVLVGGAAAIVAVVTPAIIRLVWATRPLGEGPLRDRLMDLAGKLRLRFNDILVWRCGGMIVNAAVMGVVAPLRYVVITDGMLELLDDDKIEAVFGHEAGHVKRGHLRTLLALAFIVGCLLAVVSARARGLDPHVQQWVGGAAVGALVLVFGLTLVLLSHSFERQADLFGVRTLTLAGVPCGGPCVVHGPGGAVQGAAEGAPVCRSAAQVFGLMLNEVARLNGIPPDARDWRHPSISSRSRFVARLALDPQAAERFERRVTRMQWAILAAAAAVGVWAGVELELWKLMG